MYMVKKTNLVFASIELIYDNGVLDIFHNNVLINHFRSFTWVFPFICFDPKTIVCTYQSAVLHHYSSHIRLVVILSKTTDAAKIIESC